MPTPMNGVMAMTSPNGPAMATPTTASSPASTTLASPSTPKKTA